MKPVHKFIVTAHLPKKLAKLKELAYNYWWCWNSDARELFKRVDRTLWEDVKHNPVQMINKLPQEKVKELSEQTDFTSFLNYVHTKFIKYMDDKTWYDSLEEPTGGSIVYFSPEFGINESFPNYSGGLGVLSGDHLKSASDLGLPMIGMGLLYQQGYFRQHLTQSGWQNEIYPFNDFYSMPIMLVKDENNEPLIINVELPYAKAFAQVWKMNLGRIHLYLLDTNIEQNSIEEYRDITDQLYGGTRDTRIQQEIFLGIGGMRALKAMDLLPNVVHINEGHAAFALLERTRMFMEQYGMDFYTAKQITRSSSAFTTHTPVPAGNETFRLDRMENYFHDYYHSLGLSQEEFFKLGQESEDSQDEKFSMTVLGLRMTSFHNGVSQLHGKVSRNMWHRIWRCFPEEEVPIKAITNGIHTTTWVAWEFGALFNRYLSPSWRIDPANEKIWKNVDQIPSEELYREKQRRRVRLVLFTRDYLFNKQKNFLPPDQVNKIHEYLDTDALTIGFARRFATYKRALLLFRDMERLSRICKDQDKPVQIIMAGKAHPHDNSGKEVIQSIIQKIRDYELEHNIVFLEDYDMVIARLMVKGCDVWLNTPVRPQEASGTSGMKGALNGTLNLSVLDGWWDEAYNGMNGFAIGDRKIYENREEQDIIESESLYDLLEHTVIPMFYDRSISRVPSKWVNYMKETIKTNAPRYSTSRMIKEYTEMFYIPALKKYKTMTENNAENAHKLREWKDKVHAEWGNIYINDVSIKENGEAFVGKPIKLSAVVELGALKPEDVIVQVYYGSLDHNGELTNTEAATLEKAGSDGKFHHYEGEYTCPDTGMQGFTIRVLPNHDLLVDPAELYVCAWAKD